MRPGDAPYDGFAETFAREAAVSAYNAHYDRPTVLGLLGDVNGLDILDAGCGPGLYLSELVARGARPVGIDQSTEMVHLAHERLGSLAEVRQHDLAQPLTWADDERFDVVLLTLVLHYLPDRIRTLRELARVLRPGGQLVVSTSHPTADWLASGGSYFTRGYVEETWSNGMTHRYWHQPLQAWLDEFTAAGLTLDRLVEHQPVPSMARHHPLEHEKLNHQPGFMAIQLRKRHPAI
ncbi:class I SAM-dependent methyltransferase [Streptomyces sp. H27-G5]|uniref:class I SAM-dependent methyltransferase n=1 Tax=Streptomyces sp. H27-G5 TaxID=2996698 RepID=UPI002271BEA1|nr:class I SAM-dependent methyltransferase [Streptomyces sp. H27-G5]MCY0923090.1 class I SAM-dependent methyltransferase [Streptomyces sp. H27-G5]